MLLTQPTLYYAAATTTLIAFASSVEAKAKAKGKGSGSSSSSSQKFNKPIVSGGSSGGCYDSQFVHVHQPSFVILILSFCVRRGNPINCPITKTQWIIIGAIAGQHFSYLIFLSSSSSGAVVLIIVTASICCVIRKKMQHRLSQKKDTMGVHHKVPSVPPPDEATIPIYQPTPVDPHYKQAVGDAQSEKSHYSTPYDPPQQYHHQYSETASINSSVYNVPPLTYAQPQDYSYQHHYADSADIADSTVQPGITLHPHHPSTNI